MTAVAPHGIPHKRLAKRVLGVKIDRPELSRERRCCPFANSIGFCFFFTSPVRNLNDPHGNILNCGSSHLSTVRRGDRLFLTDNQSIVYVQLALTFAFWALLIPIQLHSASSSRCVSRKIL